MVVQQLIPTSPSRDTTTIPLLHLPVFFQQSFWPLGWGPFSWSVFLQAHWPTAPLSHLIPRESSFQQFSDQGISSNAGPARSLHEKMAMRAAHHECPHSMRVSLQQHYKLGISWSRQQSGLRSFVYNSQKFSFWRGWFSQRIHWDFVKQKRAR